MKKFGLEKDGDGIFRLKRRSSSPNKKGKTTLPPFSSSPNLAHDNPSGPPILPALRTRVSETDTLVDGISDTVNIPSPQAMNVRAGSPITRPSPGSPKKSFNDEADAELAQIIMLLSKIVRLGFNFIKDLTLESSFISVENYTTLHLPSFLVGIALALFFTSGGSDDSTSRSRSHDSSASSAFGILRKFVMGFLVISLVVFFVSFQSGDQAPDSGCDELPLLNYKQETAASSPSTQPSGRSSPKRYSVFKEDLSPLQEPLQELLEPDEPLFLDSQGLQQENQYRNRGRPPTLANRRANTGSPTPKYRLPTDHYNSFIQKANK
ncbi:BA75_03100T0 [Komagataella pastoris]|uniref:BA75_03100T0 n=1 Tax=Komagataella pastoris TaxID=4922 RepID=A0A1B2JEK7_PICPA|nr:BA75_03100T0 [Komagataella pastoris]